MTGKILNVDFSQGGNRKVSKIAAPWGDLTNQIVQQFLEDADAPIKKSVESAVLYELPIVSSSRGFITIGRRCTRRSSVFTLAFLVNALSDESSL
jgi:hypothetical protein